MKNKTAWDWQTEEKQVPIKEWENEFNWVQEPCVSPDGEKVAAIVNIDEMEFGVCVNGEAWPETFEKAWALKTGGDARMAALVSNDEEWTVCMDGANWDTWFDFIWNLDFSPDGSHVSAAIQKDMEYGMAVDDRMWENLYQSITGMIMSPKGDTAAVVQVDAMAQADISAYAAGIFAVARNGEVVSDKFVNIDDITFDPDSKNTAFTIRKNKLEYAPAMEGGSWRNSFQYCWAPSFINNGQSIVAPVRLGGKWHLFKDETDFWKRPFGQLHKLAVHDPAGKIAAVVSEDFGKWGICENNRMLNFQCDTMISDLFYTPDGSQLIAVFKNRGTWDIAVNGTQWGLKADKLWAPSVDQEGSLLATRMEKNGKYFVIVNGTVASGDVDMAFEPEISPDNEKILLKTIKDGIYRRQILPLDRIL